MNQYNTAFFNLYENFFKTMSVELGQEKAIDIFTKVMEAGLKKSYDYYGFVKGDPRSFAKVLKERDNFVGIEVEFPEVSDSRVIYRFKTDPFPNLKGSVEQAVLDKTYLNFKIEYLLGDNWSYKTTKHFWNGDDLSEHIITKIN